MTAAEIAFVRSCFGRSSTSVGIPSSTIPPVVHEDQAVSDLTGEPHLVRDDDHREVMFGEARRTASTSPTSSGSRAEVTSSNRTSSAP